MHYIDASGNDVQITLNGALDLSSGLAALTIKDANLTIENASDTTKHIKFDASAITTSTTRTFTLPDVTDTLTTNTATQTLTNKTLNSTDTATGIRLASFTPDGTNTLTAPAVTDTLTSNAAAQTLTNKILTGNTAVNLVSGSGILTLPTAGTVVVPNGSDTLVNLAGSQTLTNKSLGNTTPVLGGNAIQFNNSTNTFATSLEAGTNTSNVTFKLPIADGTNGQVLTTDGSQNLSFTTSSGGGGTGVWTPYTPVY